MEGEDDVVAAEAEGVTEGCGHALLHWGLGDEVEVDARVRVFEVGGGRALTADAFVSLYILAICTGPSPALALARARPLNTARAAFWASSGSDLPR